MQSGLDRNSQNRLQSKSFAISDSQSGKSSQKSHAQHDEASLWPSLIMFNKGIIGYGNLALKLKEILC